jgi:rod shape-determining protein MreB
MLDTSCFLQSHQDRPYMFKRISAMFSKDLSIDLGTANTLVYEKGNNIILNQPSVIAIKTDKDGITKSVAAVGEAAKLMLGRTPKNIETIRPLRDGVIADFIATERLIKHFIKESHSNSFFTPSPRILICVPCQATQVERKAIEESTYNAGASKVFLIEEPMAAAIGAGLPVTQAMGSMIVDIGGGTSEIAVISLNGIVYAESVRVGGDKFDDAIIHYVRRQHGVVIGEATAEKIKKEIGTAYESEDILEIEVTGRHLGKGVPYTFKLNSSEILEAIQEPLSNIVDGVLRALEKSPAELSSDIAEKGIYLAGGGALLRDIDKLIEQRTGVPTYIADDPLTCVARGGSLALDLLDEYGEDLFSAA